MHYFQFEIKEWVSNTAHLSLEEEAIYLRLVNYYYDSERAILEKDIDMILRKCRISNKEMALLILSEYFDYEDEAFHHVRCEKEIAKYHAKSEQASRAGKASAEKRFNTRSTDVQPIINHKSLIINQESIKKQLPEGFDLFWNAYDKKVGKPNSLKAWSKIAFKDDLLQKIVEKARADKKAKPDNKFRKDPERWLKGQHWLDEVIVEQVTKPKELPLGTEQQIEEAYRVECGGDPRLARFNSYFEMKKFILDKREKGARA
jgi:uncharacterized protein YdaU (DUF1376 family)